MRYTLTKGAYGYELTGFLIEGKTCIVICIQRYYSDNQERCMHNCTRTENNANFLDMHAHAAGMAKQKSLYNDLCSLEVFDREASVTRSTIPFYCIQKD